MWSLIQFVPFIERIGWIEHTNDWDITFEVTTNDGNVYFVAGPIVPLLYASPTDPIEFTEENGVNQNIQGIKIGGNDYDVQDENGNELPFARSDTSLDVILKLTDIQQILLTR